MSWGSGRCGNIFKVWRLTLLCLCGVFGGSRMLEALKIFKTLVVGLKRNMFNACFFLVFLIFYTFDHLFSPN